jgi:hypothetical protein
MRCVLVAVVACLMVCSCGRDGKEAGSAPLITREDQLDAHVGEVVTVRGKVTNTKVPTILGADVALGDPDLRSRRGEATGILERYVVTQEELDALTAEMGGPFQNRGPGTFYRLRDEETNETAQVRAPSRR